MREDLGAYRDLGARVVAVSVDSPWALQRFRAECGADFPFLSDFNREAARAFGVLRESPSAPASSASPTAPPSSIAPTGRIAYAWHSTNPGLLPPFEEIKRAVRLAAAAP